MAEDRSVYNPVTKERFVTGVTSADTGGAYVEGTALFPVGARPPGIHRHPHQDEQITVVQGRIKARLGSEEKEFGPGDTVLLPKGAWHDFWVIGDEPAELVARATPSLGLELLLTTLAGLAAEGKTDKKGRPRPLQGAVIGQFFYEVAHFKTPPPAVQKVLLPLLAAVGKARGLKPYYDRHFEPSEIDSILETWAAHRTWAGNQRP